ncbi:MAG: hypothetical protein IT305_28505 [Chloroflexi bacterium]|nr:hypothetical protein [Chloroflexota bacterium]
MLDDVRVAEAAGGRLLQVRHRPTPLSRDLGVVLMVAEPRSGTYRLFRLSDEAGRAKLTDYLKAQPQFTFSPGVVSKILAQSEKMIAGAAAERARQVHQQQGLLSPGPVSPLTSGTECSCDGAQAVEMVTYDPAFIDLTRTFAQVSWSRSDRGDYVCEWENLWGYGNCWANPDTGLSSWHRSSCQINQFRDVSWVDESAAGDYYNYDFLDPILPTFVFDYVGVSFVDGMVSWNSIHYDEGEASGLIFGWFLQSGYNRCPQ